MIVKAVKTLLALVVVVAGAVAAEDRPAGAPDRDARIAATGLSPGLVDGKDAHRLVAAGITVVDVRTPAEYGAGHVPGAINIPYDEVAMRHADLGPPSTAVLIYCQSGRRSRLAAATMRELGFTRIFDLQAYERWVESDEPPAAR